MYLFGELRKSLDNESLYSRQEMAVIRDIKPVLLEFIPTQKGKKIFSARLDKIKSLTITKIRDIIFNQVYPQLRGMILKDFSEAEVFNRRDETLEKLIDSEKKMQDYFKNMLEKNLDSANKVFGVGVQNPQAIAGVMQAMGGAQQQPFLQGLQAPPQMFSREESKQLQDFSKIASSIRQQDEIYARNKEILEMQKKIQRLQTSNPTIGKEPKLYFPEYEDEPEELLEGMELFEQYDTMKPYELRKPLFEAPKQFFEAPKMSISKTKAGELLYDVDQLRIVKGPNSDIVSKDQLKTIKELQKYLEAGLLLGNSDIVPLKDAKNKIRIFNDKMDEEGNKINIPDYIVLSSSEVRQVNELFYSASAYGEGRYKQEEIAEFIAEVLGKEPETIYKELQRGQYGKNEFSAKMEYFFDKWKYEESIKRARGWGPILIFEEEKGPSPQQQQDRQAFEAAMSSYSQTSTKDDVDQLMAEIASIVRKNSPPQDKKKTDKQILTIMLRSGGFSEEETDILEKLLDGQPSNPQVQKTRRARASRQRPP